MKTILLLLVLGLLIAWLIYRQGRRPPIDTSQPPDCCEQEQSRIPRRFHQAGGLRL